MGSVDEEHELPAVRTRHSVPVGESLVLGAASVSLATSSTLGRYSTSLGASCASELLVTVAPNMAIATSAAHRHFILVSRSGRILLRTPGRPDGRTTQGDFIVRGLCHMNQNSDHLSHFLDCMQDRLTGSWVWRHLAARRAPYGCRAASLCPAERNRRSSPASESSKPAPSRGAHVRQFR